MNWVDLKDKLRKPQIKSLELTQEYLESTETKACLIHMPTGSGKSGIISVISNLQFEDCIIVITPRIALTKQLYKSVKNKFFEKDLGITPNPKKKIFDELKSDYSIGDDIEINNFIFFCTIQKLDWIKKNNNQLFNLLINSVKLLIFDEGHYEPAVSWSKTIRKFNVKKILFTATPFRNDLKPFEISDSHIYSYKYHDGIEDKYLRNVHFKSHKKIKDTDHFLEQTFNLYYEKFGPFNDQSPKLIIRCSHKDTIVRLANSIEEKFSDISYIAIHETFESKHKKLLKHVPDILPNVKVWIHQNKLLEGIDDSNFKMLSIYDDFGNDRALIQQIGRLVRINKKNEDYKSYVIDFSDGKHEQVWQKYLEFDKSLQITLEPLSKKTLDELFKVGNKYEYLINGFKQKFDFETRLSVNEILLPLKVNFINKQPKFTLKNLLKFIKKRLEENDRRYFHSDYRIANTQVHVLLTAAVATSPYLKEHYSITIDNNIIVFFIQGDTLCFYDSSGYVPLREKKLGLAGPKASSNIKKIFKDRDTTIGRVSLVNSNLGPTSIRNHTIAASSIDDTVSYLDDNAHVVSTIKGKYKEFINVDGKPLTKITNRYIGISKGKVTEDSSWVELDKYVEWVKDIYSLTEDNLIKLLPVFERYSSGVDDEIDTEPKHILLDISEIRDEFRLKKDLRINGELIKEKNSIILSDYCSEVEPIDERSKHFKFKIKISDNINTDLYLKYDSESKSYEIGNAIELNKLFEPTDTSIYKSVSDYLNRRQSFKIIPQEQNIIYSYGEFYRINSGLVKGSYFLDDILIPLEELSEVDSEKGLTTRNDENNWASDSIFDLLDYLGNPSELKEYLKNPSVVVCEDMNTEIADFIYAYDKEEERKVIFVHAKQGKGSKYGASPIQEVTSQASKNIKYLNSYFGLPDDLHKKWNSPWKSKGIRVNKRIRNPRTTGKPALNRINKIIKNPNSDREVWIVLGKTLSKKEFIKALKNNKYEAIQASLLLHSTLQTVGTVGAKLKVFCSP